MTIGRPLYAGFVVSWLTIIWWLPLFPVALMAPKWAVVHPSLPYIYGLTLLMLTWVGFVVLPTAARLNDMGKPVWLAGLMMVPIANFCLAVWAMFAPGIDAR